tara:strand:+ start:260 stop:556 length:297 start_codon:yes stop_codon:yes gene_type:complete
MTKARDLANLISAGILADGAISVAEVTGLTTELSTKASSTALTAAINGLGTASALNVGTGANQIVQLNGSGQIPALNASNLTGIDGVSAAALLKYGAL